MASQTAPEIAPEVRKVPRSARVDPTGRVVLPEVPDDLLQRWRDDRAALQAEAAEAAIRHASEAQILAKRIGELRRLVDNGYFVGRNLRGLVYLFEKAVLDDGPESPLTTASHIVLDCLSTMASRLEALERQAAAIRTDGGPQ